MRESFIEIDSKRLKHNWDVFKQKIHPDTKILANLKGNAYGLGAYQVGRLLESYGADYFSVAYINEGVALRQKGIKTKLLVFNPSFETFEPLLTYQLEPEVSSLAYLKVLNRFLSDNKINGFPIHIKLDTGMHRAGITAEELPDLIKYLTQMPSLKVASVFSHLAASEDPNEDAFTLRQIADFEKMTASLSQALPYKFFRHLLNTAGVFRFPLAQYDMIRPGLGLFGYHLSPEYQTILKPVMQLKTKINQVKHLKPGDTVGYNRQFKADKPMKIGLLPLGYADGIDRRLGYGNYTVKCANKLLPIVGTISMDTMSIDLTGSDCKAGDEVVVIDNDRDVYNLSEQLNTIPYTIISDLSHRLKRKVI